MNYKNFNHKLNLILLVIFVLAILSTWRVVYPLTIIGLLLFIHQTVNFVYKLGKEFPVRELIGILSSLQLLVMPFLDYHVFPNLTFYRMKVDESIYMNFALPGNILMILCLNFKRWNRGVDYNKLFFAIKNNLKRNSNLGIGLIIFGFLNGLILNFVPANLRFMFLLMSYTKFIGVLYLIYSDAKLHNFWLIIIYGSLLLSSIYGGMFIDLFIWGLLLIIILSYKYHTSTLQNASFLFVVFLFAFVVQSFKSTYRAYVWKYEINNPVTLFSSLFIDAINNPETLIDRQVIDYQIARINQGWIVAKVMNQVPLVVPYAKGSTIVDAVYASVFPRFIVSSKTGAGDKDIFQEFTGHTLAPSTTMNLGLFGEAYANFGPIMGIIFVGLFGLLLNFVIFKIEYYSKFYPTIILWLPFILTYPIRPGNDITVLLNYLVKSLIVTLVFFYLFRKKLKLKVEKVTNTL